MKNYIRPEIDICLLNVNDIITLSGANGLINKGENGQPATESFSSLFDAK